MRGLAPRTEDWRAELPWIRAAGDEGLILFESVSEGLGALQDQLRGDGFQVVGGSAYGDRLENDRAFAHQVLAEIGFPAGHVWAFGAPEEAVAFIAANPSRYVLKRSGAGHSSGDTYVGRLPDGRDVTALLRTMQGHEDLLGDIQLMAFINGVEMGVGAYFDGARFVRPACLDWEHKRFFAGDMGEMTGEMGTVATYDDTDRFFEATLAKMEGRLRAHGHVGYVNLNTIVNEAGVWPLEFTCRFGYPGYAVLAPLQATSWADLFAGMARRTLARMETSPGFCVGLVLTTPPFPYSRQEVDAPIGLPVLLDEDATPEHYHYGEVGLDASGQLVTTGLYGWTMVVTGVAPTIGAAKAAAYANARKVFAPNMRYRLDIANRLIAGDLSRVRRLGWLQPS